MKHILILDFLRDNSVAGLMKVRNMNMAQFSLSGTHSLLREINAQMDKL